MLDIEFAEWSNLLFDEFIKGNKIAVVSDILLRELSNAYDNIKEKLLIIPKENFMLVEVNHEIEFLADLYISSKALTHKSYEDALHIACSTYYNIDILVSWNFKHIVNYNRIIQYNAINLANGYKTLEIRNPKEVLNYE